MQTPPHSKRRRKKRGLNLFISYAVRAAILLVVLLCIALPVLGCMYIGSLLSAEPDSSSFSSPPSASVSDPIVSPEPDEPAAPAAETYIAVVAVDAGHGGIDPGCVSGSVLEKDITIAVARCLQTVLEEQHIKVVLTRQGDENIGLAERVRIAAEAGADYFISLHCNSYEEDTSVSGLECYSYQSDAGAELARLITGQAAQHGLKVREVKEANYQVLRDASMPAVLIEMGFITNPQECAALLTPERQEAIAAAVSETLLSLIGSV